MIADSSRQLFVAAFLASASVMLVVASGSGQTLDYSLNLTYADPFNPNSGGTWELVAKTIPGANNFGIATAVARISGINDDTALTAPHGMVNGSDIAGFKLVDALYQGAPAFHELTVAQIPDFPLFADREANLFYGVGLITNGSPAPGIISIGPTFTSLTNRQNIPWAPGDTFLHDAIWDTAASLAAGTFSENVTPYFVSGGSGNVYTTIPANNNSFGNQSQPLAITNIVRTNLMSTSADYDQDGIVSGADYVLWRKLQGSATVPPGSGADGNHDGTVNLPDYTLWRARFGNPAGSGSGGITGTTVPEPSTLAICLLAFAATAARHRRSLYIGPQSHASAKPSHCRSLAATSTRASV